MSTRVCCFFAVDDLKSIPGVELFYRESIPCFRTPHGEFPDNEHLLFSVDPKAAPAVWFALPHGNEWTKGCELQDLLTKARLSGVKVNGPWSIAQGKALGYATPTVMDGDSIDVVEKIAYEPTDKDVTDGKPPDKAKVFAAVTAAELKP